MSEQLQIAIVGGGIGGLTAALALRARGLSATVYEQAGELREIGAGFSLFPNAALLLHRLGLTDEIAKIGCPNTGQVIRTSVGELITASTTPSATIPSSSSRGISETARQRARRRHAAPWLSLVRGKRGR